MKNKALKALVTILLIIAMTFGDFLFVSVNLVTSALENIDDSTEYDNIKFAAYFKMGAEETTQAEYCIDSNEMKLYLKVAVENEGYLDGVITLGDDANFKLKNKILSDNISQIDGNTIVLNRVRAGNTAIIEVEIEPIIKENYKIEMLSKESVLSLTGKYYDSTQDSTEKYTSIKDVQKEVALTLLAPTNLDTMLSSRVITNINYELEETKRLVQVEVNSSVIDNAYPVERTVLKVELPQGAEIVEVLSKGTYATNGKADEVLKQYTNYQIENNILTVGIENRAETISWQKDAKDSIVITYKLDEENVNTDVNYSIKSIVEFYGEEEKIIEKNEGGEYNLSESKVGIVTSSIENKEEIHKGKIYAKEDREYETITNIEINYASLVENAIVDEKTAYKKELDSEELEANVQYKATTISKLEIEKVLGDVGMLTIRDGQGNIIQEITKSTLNEKSENVIIIYPEGVKQIKIELTQAVESGIIRLKHVKVIKEEIKEDIAQIKYLLEKANVKDATEENNLFAITELKETMTVAELTVVPQILSTAASTEVTIGVTLRTDDEKYDLYKNPTLKIKLPDCVKNLEVIKTTRLYLGDMEIKRYVFLPETSEIEVILSGEQTTFSGLNTNMYIEIIANIELEETTPNMQSEITLTYTNENARAYHNDGKDTVPVNISGISGLLAYNKIASHNLKTNSVTSNKSQMGSLKMYQEATEEEFQIALVNNLGEDLKDVRVLGNLPVQGEVELGNHTFNNTVAATLKSGINVETEGATVYYTANRKATNDLSNAENGWTTTPTEDSALYMIVMPDMYKSTNFKANYTMKIPANLQIDKEMKSTYVVDYAMEVINSEVEAVPVGLETGNVAVTLDASVGTDKLNDGDTVKVGEVIHYKVTLENTGSTIAENVRITGLVPEGTVLVEPTEKYEYNQDKYYDELQDTTIEKTYETLASGESKIFEYEVRAKSTTNVTAENQITVLYNENVEVKSNTLSNTVEEADIRVTVKRVSKINAMVPGTTAQYYIIVENISNQEQQNVQVKFNMPDDAMTLELVQELSGEILGTNSEWTIDTISAGSCKKYEVFVKANEVKTSSINLEVNSVVTQNNNIYRSNVYTDILYGIDVEMKMSSQNEGEYVKAGDIIEYNIQITNKSQISEMMMFVDNIPEQLTIQEILIEGENQELSGNAIYKALTMEPNSSKSIKISTVVDYDIERLENETIVNVAKLLRGGVEFISTDEISHILESTAIKDEEAVEPEQPESPGNPQGPTEPENPEEPTEPENPNYPNNGETPGGTGGSETKNKYDISGKAWIDQDKDGEMNNTDEILGSIKVKLLNVDTNEFVRDSKGNKDLIVETNEKGYYTFEDIEEGKYIVVFEYDAMLYKPTTYEKEGISESRNSNVISRKLTVNGESKEYAATNEIEVKQNISNINMGLVFVKQFDVKVDKYVSKVIVQDSKETKAYEYTNKNFAKVEINAKRIVGATILVQYTMKLTNTGDVDAYVNSLVDYIPSGLKFSSELNKDWYEVGTDLYTNSLGTTAIAPGESKEINLVLTKTKTDGNAELINNMAEISDANNIYGIQDTNSTQENKNKDENDLGSADLIISIQTGTVFNYIALVISMLLIIGAAVYVINKKVLYTKM